MANIAVNCLSDMPIQYTKTEKIARFNPNGVGNMSSGLFGLPFEYADAEIVIIPVPWEVTTSYKGGTAQGPEALLHASPQLDLFDFDVADAWKIGTYLLPISQEWKQKNALLREKSAHYIHYLELGGKVENNIHFYSILAEINSAAYHLNQWVTRIALKILADGKIPAVLGGDHSSPLGLIEALAKTYPNFGILQIDAHADLRQSYEGFVFSHASIMYNALKYPQVSKLIQVGVRDICEDEVNYIKASSGRIVPYYDHELKRSISIEGSTNWAAICKEIVEQLPDKVYISFDIDGLDPKLCPNTGTPVPGGFELHQVFYLFNQVIASGREIIGFDLCEVAPSPTEDNEWDANVGARALYKLATLTGAKKIVVNG